MAGVTPTKASVASDKVTIKVTAQKDVWMRVTADGVKKYEATLAQGLSNEWVGTGTIRIRTGRGAVVKLTITGNEKGLMGNAQKPIVEK